MSYEKREPINSSQELELTYQKALEQMDETIEAALKFLPKPRRKMRGQIEMYRFAQKDSTTALFLKMVQLTSNLRAGKILIEHRFLYEWAIIKRLLNETIEDMMFLVAGEKLGNWTKTHEQYLVAFYAENINKRGVVSQKKIRSVQRHEIRSFLSKASQRIGEQTGESSSMENYSDCSRVLHGFYSGYIHGIGPSIMRCYDPEKNYFFTNGVDNLDNITIETKSFWLLAYLAIMSFAVVGSGWWGKDYWLSAIDFAERFAQVAGIQEELRNKK